MINLKNIKNEKFNSFKRILQKKISVLSWNCCGDKLVIATGEHYHTQWCNHLNSVFVYTMSKYE